MSSVKRLISNTSSMFIAQALQPFLTILLVVIIGRTLGKEIYGQYTIIFQIFSIFQITCSLGLKTLLTREVAKDRNNANKYLVNGFLLGIPAAFINILIAAGTIFFLNYDSNIAIGSYLIIISLVAASLADVFAGVLTGFEEVKKLAYTWIIFLVLKTGMSIVVLVTGYGLYALIIIHVVTKFIQAGITYFYIYRITGKPIWQIDWPLNKRLIRMGWSLALLAISVSLFWRIDAIMLSKMVSDEMVGNYGAAYRIFHFLLMTVRSFSMAFFPMISAMYVDRQKEFRKACRKGIRYLTLLVLPIALLSTFTTEPIMGLIWGNKFDIPLVSRVFIIMIWSLIPFSVTEIVGSALIAGGRQVTHFTAKTIALGLKFVLNYYLTLSYGIAGPAISTLIALAFLFILEIPFVVPNLLRFKWKTVFLPPTKLILAIGVTSIGLYYLQKVHFSLALIGGTLIYVGMLFLLQLFTSQDKKYFQRLMKRKPKKKTAVMDNV